MHVSPGVPDPRKDRVVQRWLKDADILALTSRDLEAQRPGNRALIASRLEMIFQACLPHIRGEDEDGTPILADFRYVDLAARTLDRLAKVLQVHLPDPEEPGDVELGRSPAAVEVSRSLDALEGRLRGTGEQADPQ